jgi:hypothetical protein
MCDTFLPICNAVNSPFQNEVLSLESAATVPLTQLGVQLLVALKSCGRRLLAQPAVQVRVYLLYLVWSQTAITILTGKPRRRVRPINAFHMHFPTRI